ncbi:hypothetical protein CONLIGDRAFT_144867 [Coniochaeta ligniaria NRRL 30616]|uniref:Uncharacterized protein n=1 Tax=Coniochaeta ligniaria NRRL 30616 TaxID=1408157 RepID=A0A1J7IP84_9PEZI|nr:hypothetical protein CONLIGDRAFT_144867 [Coniochaeta ligniaria NRRL 30616]
MQQVSIPYPFKTLSTATASPLTHDQQSQRTMASQPQNADHIQPWTITSVPGGPAVPADLANIVFDVVFHHQGGYELIDTAVPNLGHYIFRNANNTGNFAYFSPLLPNGQLLSHHKYQFEFDANYRFIRISARHAPIYSLDVLDLTTYEPVVAIPAPAPQAPLSAAAPAAPLQPPAPAAPARTLSLQAEFAQNDASYPLPPPWWAPQASRDWVAAEILLLTFEAKRGPYQNGGPMSRWAILRLAQWGFSRTEASIDQMRLRLKRGSPSWFDLLDQEASTFVGQGLDPNGIALRNMRRGLLHMAPAAGQNAANIWV